MLTHRHSTLLSLSSSSVQTKHSLTYRNTPILNLSVADLRHHTNLQKAASDYTKGKMSHPCLSETETHRDGVGPW